MNVRNICVLGLGKLGSPIAACMASSGHQVIAVDVDSEKVERINEGLAPVTETGLQEEIQAAGPRLSATLDTAEAVASSDATFIVVPTPSESEGGFSLKYVLESCDSIGSVLRDKPGYHLVVITSTVMPGATGGPIKDALEASSGKKVGSELGLCYSPEFIALGSVIHDFKNPDFLLIGEGDPVSGDVLEALYKEVLRSSPPVARMNFVNAELTKLAINTFVTTKISFANMLARICEQLPDGNVDVVTGAIGLDGRIGPRYLKGAVSYGGPCFPRDNLALSALGRLVGANADIAEATDAFNRKQVSWLAALAKSRLTDGGAVGIIGLTYKPDSEVVDEAPGFLLARTLAEHGTRLILHDAHGPQTMDRLPFPNVSFASSVDDCIAGSSVVVLATPVSEIASVEPETWSRRTDPITLIDCWRVAEHLREIPGVNYMPLGIGASKADLPSD